MADKNTTVQNPEASVQAPDDTSAATKAAPSVAKPKMVKFDAPYFPGVPDSENDILLIHNGKRVTVQRGNTVEITSGHKKVWDRSQKLLKEAQERARKRQEQYKNAGK